MQHMCHMVQKDSQATNIEIWFVDFISPEKEVSKPEYPEKIRDDQLQKMRHTKAWKFKLLTTT